MPKFTTTSIAGVIIVDPEVYRDERGLFLESYHAEKYRAGGIPAVFVQDNQSLSRGNTLRGLHGQEKHPQGKLLRVIEGEIFDVAVDLRPGSPTFGKHEAAMLSAENFRQFYIPPGFAHGFCVLSGRAQIEYKCTDFYRPGGRVCHPLERPRPGHTVAGVGAGAFGTGRRGAVPAGVSGGAGVGLRRLFCPAGRQFRVGVEGAAVPDEGLDMLREGVGEGEAAGLDGGHAALRRKLFPADLEEAGLPFHFGHDHVGYDNVHLAIERIEHFERLDTRGGFMN